MGNRLASLTRRLVACTVTFSFLAFAGGMLQNIYAQQQKQQQKKSEKKETFTRPKPTEVKPTIPSTNRYQEDKVFLENADSLYRLPQFEPEERQIVKGNVKFRQGGMWMFCDSAYYFPESNSLDGFGHVKMQQGDTLFVYADKLYYNGMSKKAILTRGPSQGKVILKDPQMTLTTDSLDYNLSSEVGWYTTGGKLEDKVNTLTSVYGDYSPATKIANFRQNVVLVNNKDDYKMYTEDLIYNTSTNIAEINSHTIIEGANDTIITSKGIYNTRTDSAELMSRSTIIHRDSSMNVVTLEGDSIIYDKSSRMSRAYMFKSPWKRPAPMIITDTARKMILIGGYGEYNDLTKRAFATYYPLLMEFSRPDTLFLRADTILTYTRTELVWPENFRMPLSAERKAELAALGSLQDIADLMHITITLTPEGLVKIVDPNIPESELTPEEGANEDILQETETTESDGIVKTVIDTPEVNIIPTDSAGVSRLESDSITAFPPDSIEDIEKSNVNIIRELAQKLNEDKGDDEIYAGEPQDSAEVKKSGARIDSLGRDSAYMVPKEFRVAKAYYRARFFNQDMQGIADSIEYQEYDSMLYLFTKPIIWSGERQVMGNRIDIHFNDSTTDRAYLPEHGIMSEYIDEDFYNQLAGDKMTAYFENKELKKLYVEGSVETIYLPMENDSTYNRLINAESSFMTVNLTNQQLDMLKMWPEVSGTVTPLFMIKNSQKRMQGFYPYDNLRPVREWYEDGSVHWADDLGEVPDELDEYFRSSAGAARKRKPVSPFEQVANPALPVESADTEETEIAESESEGADMEPAEEMNVEETLSEEEPSSETESNEAPSEEPETVEMSVTE